ncbi:hypothetical protein [Streptomyces sp. NPDC002265]|uniref:hypothetical protein n=1 Tax=Streptomyces sp. NPDC002265 TaxID=3154415 RepID=UPI0033319BA5
MTTMESGGCSDEVLTECLTAVDELLVRPFPPTCHDDATESGGPGHHVRVLRASHDFWDDNGGEAWHRADEELRACLDALGAQFTRRWGDPYEVDLWSYLIAGYEGTEVPDPLDLLSQLAVSMRVWPIEDHGRWLGLTVGQGDTELPLELLAVVGRTPVPEPSLSAGE